MERCETYYRRYPAISMLSGLKSVHPKRLCLEGSAAAAPHGAELFLPASPRTAFGNSPIEVPGSTVKLAAQTHLRLALQVTYSITPIRDQYTAALRAERHFREHLIVKKISRITPDTRYLDPLINTLIWRTLSKSVSASPTPFNTSLRRQPPRRKPPFMP